MRTITRFRHARSSSFASICLLICCSPVGFGAALMVDFSRDNVNPLQAGWEGFASPGSGGAAVTTSFANDSLAGAGGSVAVTLGGNTHTRTYAPATGIFAAQSDLLRDGPLMNAAGTITIGIGGLLPGVYQLTTINHTTQFGASERSPNPITVQLTDSQNTDLLITDTLFASDNASAALSTLTLQFTSDGVNPVSIDFTKPFSASGDHFAIAGLELDVIPEPSAVLLAGLGLCFTCARRSRPSKK